MKKLLWYLSVWIVLCLLPIDALGAGEAEDLTSRCRIIAADRPATLESLMDRSFATAWESERTGKAELTIRLPSGQTAGGLYICWGRMPERWSLQAKRTDGWENIWQEQEEGFAHRYIPLSGEDCLQLTMENDTPQTVSIGELYVFSTGELPAWVQHWQPPPDQADLLVLVAHPDDEHLYMGGTLPYYAGERKLKVEVAYMTCRTEQRRSELLNGLWAVGVTHYPVIGSFRDKRYDTLAQMYQLWGKRKSRGFVVELFRRFRPLVVVSHDVNGEYGHGAHRLCADAGRYAVEAAADPKEFPESAQAYGIWDVPKLYLHLYKKNALTMDWRQPLNAFGGRTALEMAVTGYGEHKSQHEYDFAVRDTGAYSCARFGLARSLVGPDDKKNDFVEHLDHLILPGLPAKGEQAVKGPAPEAWPPLPQRDDLGYLAKEGEEWVYADDEHGLWLYYSHDLQVSIQRYTDSSKPLIWYESSLVMRGDQRLRAVASNPDKPGTGFKYPEPLARRSRLVFAVSDDYFGDRRYNELIQGVIVRDGEILSAKTYKSGSRNFPNLDTMALYPDGRITVQRSKEYTAQEYIQMGATDVLSFGPVLVKDGRVNGELGTKNRNLEPRHAFGMIEPGRYVSIVVEGRHKQSRGTALDWVAERMQALGAQEALNLDGGQTVALVFMGQKLNTTGKFGPKANQRTLSGMLAAGISEKVPEK